MYRISYNKDLKIAYFEKQFFKNKEKLIEYLKKGLKNLVFGKTNKDHFSLSFNQYTNKINENVLKQSNYNQFINLIIYKNKEKFNSFYEFLLEKVKYPILNPTFKVEYDTSYKFSEIIEKNLVFKDCNVFVKFTPKKIKYRISYNSSFDKIIIPYKDLKIELENLIFVDGEIENSKIVKDLEICIGEIKKIEVVE